MLGNKRTARTQEGKFQAVVTTKNHKYREFVTSN
jgi:hypothetical protein